MNNVLIQVPTTVAEAADWGGDVNPQESPDLVAPTDLGETHARPGLIRRVWNGIGSVSEWLFGSVALVFGLAILSATPVLQLLSFGYLLESGGAWHARGDGVTP